MTRENDKTKLIEAKEMFAKLHLWNGQRMSDLLIEITIVWFALIGFVVALVKVVDFIIEFYEEIRRWKKRQRY